MDAICAAKPNWFSPYTSSRDDRIAHVRQMAWLIVVDSAWPPPGAGCLRDTGCPHQDKGTDVGCLRNTCGINLKLGLTLRHDVIAWSRGRMFGTCFCGSAGGDGSGVVAAGPVGGEPPRARAAAPPGRVAAEGGPAEGRAREATSEGPAKA
jgi:hypothetical protein